jgi:hypothetical protein
MGCPMCPAPVIHWHRKYPVYTICLSYRFLNPWQYSNSSTPFQTTAGEGTGIPVGDMPRTPSRESRHQVNVRPINDRVPVDDAPDGYTHRGPVPGSSERKTPQAEAPERSTLLRACRDHGLILSLSEGQAPSLPFHLGACIAWYQLGLLPYVRYMTGSGFGNVALALLVSWGTSERQDDEQVRPVEACMETCLGCQSFINEHSHCTGMEWRRWGERVRWQLTDLRPWCTNPAHRVRRRSMAGMRVPKGVHPRWIHQMLVHAKSLSSHNIEREALCSRVQHFYRRFLTKNIVTDTQSFFRSAMRMKEATDPVPINMHIMASSAFEPRVYFGASVQAHEYTHGNAMEREFLEKSRQPHEMVVGSCPLFYTSDPNCVHASITDWTRFIPLAPDGCMGDLMASVAVPDSWGSSVAQGNVRVTGARTVDPYGVTAAQHIFVADRMCVGGPTRWLLSDTWTATLPCCDQDTSTSAYHRNLLANRTSRHYRTDLREQARHALEAREDPTNHTHQSSPAMDATQGRSRERCEFSEHARIADLLVGFKGNICHASITHRQVGAYMYAAEFVARLDHGLISLEEDAFEHMVNWGYMRALGAHGDDSGLASSDAAMLRITSPPIMIDDVWNDWYVLPYPRHAHASDMVDGFCSRQV